MPPDVYWTMLLTLKTYVPLGTSKEISLDPDRAELACAVRDVPLPFNVTAQLVPAPNPDSVKATAELGNITVRLLEP